jgi:sucrose phosphorylase
LTSPTPLPGEAPPGDLRGRVRRHLDRLYPEHDVRRLADRLIEAMGVTGEGEAEPRLNKWSQADILAITYGDTLTRPGEAPLATLKRFLDDHLARAVNAIHVLPFFPYSSDDGFSVVDYREVNPELGGWEQIRAIGERFKVMADLVINHCSSRSEWFRQFVRDEVPGRDYFVTASPADDLSDVVRPRSTPLLVPVETPRGVRHAWCTFSADQVDLDFRNPEVLVEMVRIIARYLDEGITILRLDAVGFLWKEPGTACIHLPQTHEVLKLIRLLVCARTASAVLISETNVPNLENLTYFGNGDEAHAIYNFSLPPLLLHALLSGESGYLQRWMMSMPPAQLGNAYLNFIASHDGIGLRPAEGLLRAGELAKLLSTMRAFGGEVSMRATPDGGERPYEINISLWDAFKGPLGGEPDGWQLARFLCAHTVMLGLEGIPAFYLHSLLGTESDHDEMRRSGQKRRINRHRWDDEGLRRKLEDTASHHSQVLSELVRRIRIRALQPAFHPNATQYTLRLGRSVFGFWRQSVLREQSIFALHNLSSRSQRVALGKLNLIGTDSWYDLLGGADVRSTRGQIELPPYGSLWITNYPRRGA